MGDSDNSIDSFLTHKTGIMRGNTAMLKSWKNRTPPVIDTWMHTKRLPSVLWRHNFASIHSYEDRVTKKHVKQLWSDSLNCWEHESLLRKQYSIDDETGEREQPPVICPVCRLIDVVRLMVFRSQLAWTTPVFRFELQTEEKTDVKIFHAGGLYNAFGKKNLDAEEIEDLAKHKIFRKQAWKENMQAKANYVMTIVDHSNIAGGVQVSIEPALLGDKVKGVIADQRTSLGEDVGNPMVAPYAIRWEHKEAEEQFDKKYHATAMRRIAMTPVIEKLIHSTPPDLSRVTAKCDPVQLRTIMEHHALIKLPWEEIFAPSEAAFTKEAEKGAKNSSVERPAEINTKTVEESDDVACDVCHKPMKMSDAACPHCGEKYDVELPPAPVAPPLPPRSSKKVAAPATPPTVHKATVEPPARTKGRKGQAVADEFLGGEEGVNEGDQIPF